MLQANGFVVSSGHVRCCANHGLSLVIAARLGSDIRLLLFDAGPEAHVFTDAGNVLGGVPLYGVMGGFHLSGAEVEN